MNAKHLLLSCALAACSASAFAQWQWVDASGRKVFSDRPPPPGIQSQHILQRPPGSLPPAAPQQLVVTAVDAPTAGAAAAAEAPAAAEPAAAAAPAAAAQAQAQAQAAEAQKAEEAAAKAAAAAEAAKRQAEEAERKKQAAQQAKTRQENCSRARMAQNTLQPGMRVATINDKGERGFMPDAQRQSELSKAQSIIKDNC